MTPTHLPASYTDLAPIARGAFGEVWRARHEAFGPVAVKLLAPDQGGDPEAAWRFGQEFRRLQGLAVPHVPRAHEAGLSADGTPYFAMALAPGRSPEGPLPAAQVRALLVALAEALAGLHAAGLTHGDLKRENVVVADDGAVALVDLALAMPIGAAREGFAGTPAYLAPEAWRGAAHAPAADWYALGVLGYWLATGHPPFEGAGATLARAHAQDLPTLPADLPELAALLAKDPARRAAGVAALGVTPRPFAGLQPVDLPPRPLDDAPWHAALAGGGSVWLVGLEGGGKTRTLDAWRLDAAAAGRAWLA
ncbi:MAG: putative protein kinase, partial [Cyanobacteria bacterium RYN_339]|nr:putative protein kinase [Cyanobacteria bacterium RYN_339]